jgi:hypothetical protein
MSTDDRFTNALAIPGCTLDSPGLGAQLERYRRLARHASSVQRLPGEVRVRFHDDLPDGLLEHTMDVERRCCPFVHADYDRAERRLILTVENIDQDPRLDSLFHAIS